MFVIDRNRKRRDKPHASPCRVCIDFVFEHELYQCRAVAADRRHAERTLKTIARGRLGDQIGGAFPDLHRPTDDATTTAQPAAPAVRARCHPPNLSVDVVTCETPDRQQKLRTFWIGHARAGMGWVPPRP